MEQIDKRDRVIVISEENHGFIGVAKDLRHAINFLIEEDWIHEDETFWDESEQKWLTLSQHMAMEMYEGTWQEYLHYKVQTDLMFFDGGFYFAEHIVY